FYIGLAREGAPDNFVIFRQKKSGFASSPDLRDQTRRKSARFRRSGRNGLRQAVGSVPHTPRPRRYREARRVALLHDGRTLSRCARLTTRHRCPCQPSLRLRAGASASRIADALPSPLAPLKFLAEHIAVISAFETTGTHVHQDYFGKEYVLFLD